VNTQFFSPLRIVLLLVKVRLMKKVTSTQDLVSKEEIKNESDD